MLVKNKNLINFLQHLQFGAKNISCWEIVYTIMSSVKNQYVLSQHFAFPTFSNHYAVGERDAVEVKWGKN